jgi:hypothetical protein
MPAPDVAPVDVDAPLSYREFAEDDGGKQGFPPTKLYKADINHVEEKGVSVLDGHPSSPERNRSHAPPPSYEDVLRSPSEPAARLDHTQGLSGEGALRVRVSSIPSIGPTFSFLPLNSRRCNTIANFAFCLWRRAPPIPYCTDTTNTSPSSSLCTQQAAPSTIPWAFPFQKSFHQGANGDAWLLYLHYE